MAKIIKTYEYKNIQYKFVPSARKWEFAAPSLTLYHPANGGQPVAKLIASQMAAALTRTKGNGIDSLGHGAIKKISGY